MKANSTNPTPPRVPNGISRETGVRSPDERADYGLDGFSYSENPWEGGLNAVNGFNDEMPESERQKAVAEFNKRPSVI